MKLLNDRCKICLHSKAVETTDGDYDYFCSLSKPKCYECLSEISEIDYFEGYDKFF